MGWAVGKSNMNASTVKAKHCAATASTKSTACQRTAFEISRDITESSPAAEKSLVLIGKKAEASTASEGGLFPQTLAIVERLRRRAHHAAPGAQIEEIALARYRDTIFERLLTAIEPDVSEGEATLLPRIDRHRPIGTHRRGSVPNKQADQGHDEKPSLARRYSTASFGEGAAAYHLERLPYVVAYAKNDRLDFEILYEWQERTLKYIPDFLVAIDAGNDRRVNLILEMKGFETEQDRTKWAGALQWVRAVNNHGGFGFWDHRVCKEPNALAKQLEGCEGSGAKMAFPVVKATGRGIGNTERRLAFR